jgi:hypothetical protein
VLYWTVVQCINGTSASRPAVTDFSRGTHDRRPTSMNLPKAIHLRVVSQFLNKAGSAIRPACAISPIIAGQISAIIVNLMRSCMGNLHIYVSGGSCPVLVLASGPDALALMGLPAALLTCGRSSAPQDSRWAV